MEIKFYSLDEILKRNAQYNIIIGERSNGKTYATLFYCLKQYIKDGSQFAIIRRWKEDIRGKRAQTTFNGIVDNNEIDVLTNGNYNNVYYNSGKWYLCKYDETLKKPICDNNPFAYGFSLTDMEHDKSTSYPNIRNIVFDEFITRTMYIPDEFVTFMNCISTIVRHRNDVKIFMLGNTVNKFCPYFNEFGLSNIQKQRQGTIDLYQYGNSGLKVAVEYCDSLNISKPSDVYFAFNNPKLKMVTSGVWELDIYPHLPIKYNPKDIIFTYFIEFDDNIVQCEIVCIDENIFTYIHKKTTPIKYDNDLLFTLKASPHYNTFRNIYKPMNKAHQKLLYYFNANKVFYQDNEIGEIVRNYLNVCKTL